MAIVVAANLVYKDKQITDDLRNRHVRYKEQWDKIAELEKRVRHWFCVLIKILESLVIQQIQKNWVLGFN